MPLFGLLKSPGPPVYLYKIASLVFGPLVIGIPSYTAAPATQQWFTPKSHVGDLAVPSKNGGIAMGLDLSETRFVCCMWPSSLGDFVFPVSCEKIGDETRGIAAINSVKKMSDLLDPKEAARNKKTLSLLCGQYWITYWQYTFWN